MKNIFGAILLIFSVSCLQSQTYVTTDGQQTITGNKNFTGTFYGFNGYGNWGYGEGMHTGWLISHGRLDITSPTSPMLYVSRPNSSSYINANNGAVFLAIANNAYDWNISPTPGDAVLRAEGPGSLLINATSGNIKFINLPTFNGSSFATQSWVSSQNFPQLSGTSLGYLPKMSSGNVIINSSIYESGGNVGIRTSSPNTDVAVGGGSTDVTDRTISVQSGGSAKLLLLGDMNNDGSELGNSYVGFGQDGATSAFNTGTRASIGLTQLGSADAAGNAVPGVLGNDFVMAGSGSANVTNLRFVTENAVRMSVVSGGSVGIGTVSPKRQFHVSGATPTTVIERTTNGIDLKARYISVDPSGGMTIGKFDDAFSLATQQMVINTNGHVGIGTTDPKEYKLAVNGAAIFTKVQVKASSTPWPDYVFHSSYKLRSLSSLEAYIKQNKHLPDVPSAKEVEKEGLDLGSTQAALLRKIEELTLYVIEQEKENKKLQKRVEQLESKTK